MKFHKMINLLRYVRGLGYIFISFDSNYYKNQRKKVPQIKMIQLLHFMIYGNNFGLDISRYIDSEWIHEQYKKEKNISRKSATLRFFTRGYKRGITPNVLTKPLIISNYRHKLFFIRNQTYKKLYSRYHKVVNLKSANFQNYFFNSNVIPYNMSEKKYMVVIPSYGNYFLLKIALRMLSPIPNNVEIFVINDGYKDTIPSFFKEQFPNVKYVENKINKGFLKTINSVYSIALNYDYLILLNNDTFVESNFLYKLDQYKRDNNKIGITSVRSLNLEGKVLEHGACVATSGHGKWNNNGVYAAADIATEDIKTQYVSANAILIDSEIIKKRGFIFDELYSPAYYEDTDLCFYARENNYSVIALGSISCVHLVSATYGNLEFEKNTLNNQLMNRNRLKFQAKWSSMLEEDSISIQNKTIWWIDDTFHFRNKDAGNFRNSLLVETLLERKFKVWIVSTKFDSNPYDLIKDINILKGVEYRCSVIDLVRESFEFSFAKPGLIIISRWDNFLAYKNYLNAFFPNIKIIFDTQDLHGHRLELQESLGIIQDGLSANEIKRTESTLIRESDATLFISKEEMNKIEIAKNGYIIGIPEILINKKEIKYLSRRNILFFANFHHIPNFDGFKWFLETIWINFLQEEPHVHLDVVGSNLDMKQIKFIDSFKNTKTLGFVENLDHKVSDYLISIAPLRYGGGIKGKVLKSFAAGTPVLGTGYAFQGIVESYLFKDCIFSNSEEFIQKYSYITKNEQVWTQMSNLGKEIVSNHYSLEKTQRDFLKIVDDMISI